MVKDGAAVTDCGTVWKRSAMRSRPTNGAGRRKLHRHAKHPRSGPSHLERHVPELLSPPTFFFPSLHNDALAQMRRWSTLRAPTVACKSTSPPTKQALWSLQSCRPYQQYTAEDLRRHTAAIPNSQQSHPGRKATQFAQYDIFRRVDAPEPRVEDWTALLDGALPPHLREWSTTPPSLSAVDVAEVLLAAQYPSNPKDEAFDLLFYLGFEKDRWNAVIWLIKRLVEKFPIRREESSRFAGISAIWQIDRSLEQATEPHSSLDLAQSNSMYDRIATTSLDDLTAGYGGELAPAVGLQHKALGQIWRTLGAMTKACAGSDIRPEVLEIIAYLHHKEVMPVSIYHSEPHSDPSAVQQPPLLSLLSSRILTSLSDAAWRAHEKLVIEEAKAQDARYVGIRPEVPGSVYRVHVAGLRTEVWMELILWSCIRGGWIAEGAQILDTIVSDTAWAAISWREYANSMCPDNRFDESWEYAFKTRVPSSMDDPRGQPLEVERTVSAEVINAYIDAVTCTVYADAGKPKHSAESTISLLVRFKRLLTRPQSRLSISTGSWDALILRLLDAQGVMFEAHAAAAHMLVSLSPGFAQGLGQKNTQDLPAYVLDGGMAMQGFLHRVLYGQIASGNYEGALAAFQQIQARADRDKQMSLTNFMTGQKPLLRALSEGDLFTNNLSGIEYPAFDMQIPSGILGSFLDLLTTSKDYDLGRWLLHNTDLDGPVIKPRMYHDPLIEPAVIRFAAESNDRELLGKFKDRQLRLPSLRAVFHAQIDAMRWEAAAKILQVMKTRRTTWRVTTVAHVACVMLRQVAGLAAGAAGAAADFNAAKAMFSNLCPSRHGRSVNISDEHAIEVRNLLVVLAAINGVWADICLELLPTNKRRFDKLMLNPSTFNMVLRSVVDAYGSVAGRRLLGTFWPYSARDSLDVATLLVRTRGRYGIRPDTLASIERQRISVRVRGTKEEQELVLYGALIPNSESILIILRKALEELGSQQKDPPPVANGPVSSALTSVRDRQVDLTTEGMIAWGIRRLAKLPYVATSVIEQIDSVLAAHDMHELRGQLSELVHNVERDVVEGAEEEDEMPQSSGVSSLIRRHMSSSKLWDRRP
ncbi:hypothetical protein DOTSEDRAFT_81917 [Dothistroma septosporum NZE10]|uniref:EH domain-containing protein n=1 Tax=Dothistroma septosporum (strain NZE10 / CBS 128990) TaxID=675120 RepID=N1PHU1_DOTSN|nr:hypothetical protein DOTSEDRAFT_81917 [Dothistroma septosporum NZE10]